MISGTSYCSERSCGMNHDKIQYKSFIRRRGLGKRRRGLGKKHMPRAGGGDDRAERRGGLSGSKDSCAHVQVGIQSYTTCTDLIA